MNLVAEQYGAETDVNRTMDFDTPIGPDRARKGQIDTSGWTDSGEGLA